MNRGPSWLARWKARRKKWAAAFWQRSLRRQLKELAALEKRWRAEAEAGRRRPAPPRSRRAREARAL
jgi:hypothetical protein